MGFCGAIIFQVEPSNISISARATADSMLWTASRVAAPGEAARLSVPCWLRTSHTAGQDRQSRWNSTDLTGAESHTKSTIRYSAKRHELYRYVDPDSLQKTLDQHREAKEKSRIRFIPGYHTNGEQQRNTTYSVKERRMKAKTYSQHDPLRQQAVNFLAKSGLNTPSIQAPNSAQNAWDREHYDQDAIDHDLRVQARRKFLEDADLWTDDLQEDGSWDKLNRVLKRIANQMFNRMTSTERAAIPRDIMQYRGVPAKITVHHEPGEGLEPWVVSAADLKSVERLDAEIAKFAEWVSLTEDEQRARNTVTDMIIGLIKDVAPELKTEVFGSSATGLADPMSDIDVRLFPLDKKKVHADLLSAGIVQVADALAHHPDFDQVSMQYKPLNLVQATHVPSGLSVQIVAGPQQSECMGFVRKSLRQYPQLKSIYHVVKSMLECRDLVQPYKGYLSSYGLFNLIVASLKARDTMRAADQELFDIDYHVYCTELAINPIARRINPRAFFPSLWLPNPQVDYKFSPGLQLLDFLYFWRKFDSFEFTTSARTGELIRKAYHQPPHLSSRAETDHFLKSHLRMSPQVAHQPYLLCLQDGANKSNDLGRRAPGWKHIGATIKVLYQDLFTRMRLHPPPPIVLRNEQIASNMLDAEIRRRIEQDTARQLRREAVAEGKVLEQSPAKATPVSASDPNATPLVPFLRSLVGRADLRVQPARDRLEMFAQGQVECDLAWRPVKTADKMAKDEVAVAHEESQSLGDNSTEGSVDTNPGSMEKQVAPAEQTSDGIEDRNVQATGKDLDEEQVLSESVAEGNKDQGDKTSREDDDDDDGGVRVLDQAAEDVWGEEVEGKEERPLEWQVPEPEKQQFNESSEKDVIEADVLDENAEDLWDEETEVTVHDHGRRGV
ncbi:hypothetical protein K461DRAFT_313168 [Myriangium duriaei CBS 260.36]|uniref:Poly(A) RNA polymerase mitochondrial-like central palm domain-containing protein n=1 Tax=Myriangium duriaei CBS 260.36 TaxID=1168546 RepID=A0A9P4IZ03_9PEZI|nr:hypothetical protein K461DRAFT_313168 [Myriangium duriaei CBS 260.36]